MEKCRPPDISPAIDTLYSVPVRPQLSKVMMSHYKSNLRDIEFNLFEANHIEESLKGPFGEIDSDTAHAVLREIERLAVNDFANSFTAADRNPPYLENGEVRLPSELKKSLDAYYAGGWDKLSLPTEIGGGGAPPSLRWAVAEMLVGANPAAYFYVIGTSMAQVIDQVGTEQQRQQFCRPMLERNWGGSMVLTESEAGSDVGAGTTKAYHVEGDTYHLDGVKRFITSGDSDFFENIVHLVLARPEGSGPGTKGLSMFIVPKYLVKDDGSPGERNGIVTTNLEDKMGIKGSATCELTLGADEPCVGYLVGGVHEGIRQMFLVIADARMLIGVKSASTLSTAYLNALEYAAERVQGADLARGHDPAAPRVPILRHPNVRRLLMMQKAHAEGLRALALFAASMQDRAKLDPDEPYWARLSDLLLPLVKGYSSEKAYQLLAQSLQVFGGSGFTKDYPIEQYIRDAKIDTVYEGTTGIQALDLLFRKIAKDQGQTLLRLASQITETVKGGGADSSFEAERAHLGNALEDLQAQLGVMGGHLMGAIEDPPEVYLAGLHANALLEGLAEVLIGWLLIQHAEISLKAIGEADDADRNFYVGKVASARWFAKTVLPRAALRRSLAEAETGALMALPDEAF